MSMESLRLCVWGLFTLQRTCRGSHWQRHRQDYQRQGSGDNATGSTWPVLTAPHLIVVIDLNIVTRISSQLNSTEGLNKSTYLIFKFKYLYIPYISSLTAMTRPWVSSSSVCLACLLWKLSWMSPAVSSSLPVSVTPASQNSIFSWLRQQQPSESAQKPNVSK